MIIKRSAAPYVQGKNGFRDKDDRNSLFIALAYSSLLIFLGFSEVTAVVNGLTVAAFLMAFFTFRYCARREDFAPTHRDRSAFEKSGKGHDDH